ncbi:MAG: response regulator transcription factor [Elusimicrobia bacterium]|nr:response regulator transcription factor [Elusimicrobiota bacterium]
MRRKLLVVDDDRQNLEFLRALLEREGYEVLVADRAAEAALSAAESRPHLILSDVAMPGMGGFSLCRALRGDRRTAAIPLILMSGIQKGEAEQAQGIEQGADDYLVKPFHPRLLLAKVRAALRRAYEAPPEPRDLLRAQGLVLDLPGRTVARGKDRIALTRKEFDLLALFLKKPGRVLSVAFLLETVWGYDTTDYSDPHTIETHVSSLRRKLGPRLGRRLVSVPGLGYRLDER